MCQYLPGQDEDTGEMLRNVSGPRWIGAVRDQQKFSISAEVKEINQPNKVEFDCHGSLSFSLLNFPCSATPPSTTSARSGGESIRVGRFVMPRREGCRLPADDAAAERHRLRPGRRSAIA